MENPSQGQGLEDPRQAAQGLGEGGRGAVREARQAREQPGPGAGAGWGGKSPEEGASRALGLPQPACPSPKGSGSGPREEAAQGGCPVPWAMICPQDRP